MFESYVDKDIMDFLYIAVDKKREKDTALASTITYMELMKAASSAVNRDVNVVPYIIAIVDIIY